ncbi:MAG: GAF domain-containing protein, partial [Hyphomicrobiales bacterium]
MRYELRRGPRPRAEWFRAPIADRTRADRAGSAGRARQHPGHLGGNHPVCARRCWTEEAGITLVTRRRGFQSRAATSELPTLIDDLQYRLDDGPSVQVIWHHETVLVTDMATERRWPRFAPEAAGIGARSMLVFPLYTTEKALGALSLHSSEADAFDETAVSIGST